MNLSILEYLIEIILHFHPYHYLHLGITFITFKFIILFRIFKVWAIALELAERKNKMIAQTSKFKFYLLTTLIDRVLIKTSTWTRDSHELFDYESPHLMKKSFKI